MSGRKCRNCGSSEIEEDPARGDAVCTNCGSVLEDNIIVSEVQFEENAHGGSNAIGQFVSADSKGGATSFGNSFHLTSGVESREITLRKARQGISFLSNMLKLNQHCIDTACNFFKMALSRQLTRGRKNTHVYAACVYITCRTEGTAHLLIDVSDVQQICCYELGRTYLRLTNALCINIPSVDPCLYVLRFAVKLEFGEKTHEVSMTALRLVQRMKKDFIHSGRKPSGLCGAALLMAARLHEFSRSPNDIVKIVKVHHSTLRKRLMEFGETPTSALTLDEFMTVDLEEEQDPPSFKAARKRDKERLQKLMEEEADNLTELQREIEMQLEKDQSSRSKRSRHSRPVAMDGKHSEQDDTQDFIQQSTFGVIQDIMAEDSLAMEEQADKNKGLGPDIEKMCLANSLEDQVESKMDNVAPEGNGELELGDIDDDEINMYLMTEEETKYKDGVWNKINAAYLEQQRLKEEKLAKEREEGKPEKKKRKAPRRSKKSTAPASSAGEAIEKMLQEKRISSKINYDVLKSLSTKATKNEEETVVENTEERPNLDSADDDKAPPAKRQRKPKAPSSTGRNVVEEPAEEPAEKASAAAEPEKPPDQVPEEECEEDYEDDAPANEPETDLFHSLRPSMDEYEDEEDYY